MENANYGHSYPELEERTDEELDDTIKIREVSYMSLYPEEDSLQVNTEDLNEFEHYRKSV